MGSRQLNGITQAMRFDGVAVASQLSTAITMGIWVRYSGVGNVYGYWFARPSVGMADELGVMSVYLYISTTLGMRTVELPWNGSWPPPVNTWRYLIGTWDSGGTAVVKELDVGGAVVRTGTGAALGGTLQFNASYPDWWIGGDPFVPRSIGGQWAHARIWNRRLSDAEMVAASRGARIHSCIFHAPLAGLASLEPDISGNGNHVTLINGPTTSVENPPVGSLAPPVRGYIWPLTPAPAFDSSIFPFVDFPPPVLARPGEHDGFASSVFLWPGIQPSDVRYDLAVTDWTRYDLTVADWTRYQATPASWKRYDLDVQDID
jgi:hypothetical protein